MKTLTITISDEAAEALAEAAAGVHRQAKDVASQAVEETFGRDWFDELDDEAQTAIARGVAEVERGEFASDAAIEEAYARFKR